MKLKEIMTQEVEVVHTFDTLEEAAQRMRFRDVGILPVYNDEDQLVGVISDRDIVVRATAQGLDPRTVRVDDFMTTPAISCFENEDVNEAARLMQVHQIRRLVIVGDDDKTIVGIVSLGDVAGNSNNKLSGKILESVSSPPVNA